MVNSYKSLYRCIVCIVLQLYNSLCLLLIIFIHIFCCIASMLSNWANEKKVYCSIHTSRCIIVLGVLLGNYTTVYAFFSYVFKSCIGFNQCEWKKCLLTNSHKPLYRSIVYYFTIIQQCILVVDNFDTHFLLYCFRAIKLCKWKKYVLVNSHKSLYWVYCFTTIQHIFIHIFSYVFKSYIGFKLYE